MSVVEAPKSSGLVARVQNILLRPTAEWDVIEAEPATVPGLFTSYAAVLALVPAIGSILGAMLAGMLFHSLLGLGAGIIAAVVGAILFYVLGLAMVFVFSLIIDALASSFGATPDKLKAAKVAVYGFTASWVSGIFGFIPFLSALFALAGFGYSCYLIYLGIAKLMKPPADKAVAYAAVSIVINMVLFGIVFWIVAIVIGIMTMMLAAGAVATVAGSVS
jgi:hypothetical protein